MIWCAVSGPPVGDALFQTVLPDTVDFATITTIVGGTVGGYITYAGAHRYLESGLVGPDHVKGVHRASMQGKTLKLALGYSHDVNFEAPEGVTVNAPKQTEIVVEGIDQQAVGQTAANIREWKKPEPYKGKGIRYKGEVVFRKEGKKK